MSNAATILLELLQKVDAERLEVFLDPHVMLHLLETTGTDGDALRTRLEGGEKPGALLLSLLERHSADELWAMIPEELREHTLGKVRAQSARTEKDEKKKLAPMVLGLVGAILPTMIALGTFPEWGSGTSFGWLLFAGVVSGAAGAWAKPNDRLAAAIAAAAGSVVSVVTGLLIAPYVSGFYRLGVLAALAPGALVMGLLWLGLTWHRRTEPASF